MGRTKGDPNTPRFCKKCKSKLEESDNWAEGSVKKGFYICNSCKNEKYKKYRVNNPFKAKLSYFNKRNSSCITVEQLETIWNKQEGKCAICKDCLEKTTKHCIDHKIPKSKGGSSKLENLQFTCYLCNVGKHDFSQEEYIKHCIKVLNNNPINK